jgi:hypothetical protein
MDGWVTEYRIVYSDPKWGGPARRSSIESKVNQLIREGWQPQGGISVDGDMYYQAMVKKQPTDRTA